MFSYYEKGVKSQQMSKVITILDLLELIKNNPKREMIKKLWDLPYRSSEYDKIKVTLPTITTAGIFNGPKEAKNIFQLSEYLYFDVDQVAIHGDVEQYRKVLLESYGDKICLLSKSVGGRGLFFMIMVNGLTKDNYSSVWDYFCNTEFANIEVDKHAKGIHRSLFVPYDDNVFYQDTSISLPVGIEDNQFDSRTNTIKKDRDRCYTESVRLLPIGEVMGILCFETKVDVGDMLFRIEPVPYCKVVPPPRKIPDGRKHIVFRAITQSLLYLNPEVELLVIQSYVNWINENYTTVKMRRHELLRTVEWMYNKVKEDGDFRIDLPVKTVHINKRAVISRMERVRLATTVNGLLRVLKTVKQIEKAEQELSVNGDKPTKRAIAVKANLHEKTVGRNYGKCPNEILKIIDSLNSKI